MTTETAIQPLNAAKEAISEIGARGRRHVQTADLLREYSDESPIAREVADLAEIIYRARRTLRDLREMAAPHAHQWNDDDYCNRCGADGRS